MRPSEDVLTAPLLDEVAGLTGAEALRRLQRLGVLDRRAVEAYWVRAEVARLTSQEKMPRMRAMDEAAQRLCCSFDKVKYLIYNFFNQRQ